MEKEKEAMRKERMNDKGFSLVELIIVIAIMAILLVVLAPQYLKYVERSRNSTDLQNAAEIVTALQIYAGDPEAATPMADGTINITRGADATGIGTSGFAHDALADAGLLDGDALHTRCQSRTNWTDYEIDWDVVDGQLEFHYDATAGTGATGPTFAQRMLGQTGAAGGGTP